MTLTRAEIVDRLEELEAQQGVHRDHWETLHRQRQRVDERMDALEALAGSAGRIGEAVRQARWHATRDAYVTGALARRDADVGDDLILHWATGFADRAHGPLEGKVMPNGGEHLIADFAEYREQVNALVKAAQTCRQYARDCGGGGLIVADEMDAALKPFEVDRG